MAPDLTWMQDTSLSLVSVAAVLSLVCVTLGLYSMITGRDNLPRRIRRLVRRRPATAEDQRLHGMSMMLNGAGLMLAMLGVTAGVAGKHLGTFPGSAQFLVTILAFLTSITCLAGAYTVGVRVRLASTRASTDAHPEPPAA